MKEDAKPSRQHPYTYNDTFAKKIKEEIDKLLVAEFIYEIDLITKKIKTYKHEARYNNHAKLTSKLQTTRTVHKYLLSYGNNGTTSQEKLQENIPNMTARFRNQEIRAQSSVLVFRH